MRSTPFAVCAWPSRSQRGTAAGKRVQSAGGAKNHLIIMPDAEMDQTVKALAASAYGCAGQRCLATSLAVTVGAAKKAFAEAIHDKATKRVTGYGLDKAAANEGTQKSMQVLGFDPLKPDALQPPRQVGFGPFGKGQVVGGVSSQRLIGFAAFGETFRAVFPDRF